MDAVTTFYIAMGIAFTVTNAVLVFGGIPALAIADTNNWFSKTLGAACWVAAILCLFMIYVNVAEFHAAMTSESVYERHQFKYRLASHHAWAYWCMFLSNFIAFGQMSRSLRGKNWWPLCFGLIMAIPLIYEQSHRLLLPKDGL